MEIGDDMTHERKVKVKNNIQFLCDRDGVTQLKLAASIGASKQQVSRWVHGEVPYLGYVLRMHDIFGWSLKEMFEELKESEG